MKDSERFIRAYRDFRKSVDFSATGVLPELNNVVWCMLMGVPDVPADEDSGPQAPEIAIDQRTAILKAVFVAVNKGEPEEFLDQGLDRYDQACKIAKQLLGEAAPIPKSME